MVWDAVPFSSAAVRREARWLAPYTMALPCPSSSASARNSRVTGSILVPGSSAANQSISARLA